MGTFIHGIAASENIDSSGERISIAGMDISSLEKDGVFNWEHKADQPGQVVGKILKAKKIFSEQDCEDDYQLEFFKKCSVPYLYVMGELMDDFKESAKEVAGQLRYDNARPNQENTTNFSIEGAKIDKQGMDITKSIARKVTITVTPCNKAAVASMVPVEKKIKRNSVDELFKTEAVEIEILKVEPLSGVAPISPSLAASEMKKDQPKLTVAPPPKPIGTTRSGKAIHAGAMVGSYKDFTAEDHSDAYDAHISARAAAHAAKDFKAATMHGNKATLHAGARNTLISRQSARVAMAPKAPGPSFSGQAPKTLHDPQMSGRVAPPGPIKKALDAGSAMAAPADLKGLPALSKENIKIPKEEFVEEHEKLVDVLTHPSKKKLKQEAKEQAKELKQIKKSKWLARAEEEYQKWTKREEFENFMSKRMPHLTKGEIKAIGQVMALNKSLTLEKALNDLAGYEKLSRELSFQAEIAKAAGKDSIYTLILFEGCDLHHILHCSHFATDDNSGDTFEKIKEACDEYFSEGASAHELEFKDEGELGKEGQRVLFLTEGDPYKELFEKLKQIAEYKYPSFRPHISVTSNVDEFKGKASSLVISVNGEIKKKYDFK